MLRLTLWFFLESRHANMVRPYKSLNSKVFKGHYR
jgi:hypothetical protein